MPYTETARRAIYDWLEFRALVQPDHDSPWLNLHAADTASLALLEFIAQEIGQSRLLILGTYRDEQVTLSYAEILRFFQDALPGDDDQKAIARKVSAELMNRACLRMIEANQTT